MMKMSFMYLSTSCWLVSTLSKVRERKRKRKKSRKKNDDVLHIPVHLLLVSVDPVQEQIQKVTQRENKKDK